MALAERWASLGAVDEFVPTLDVDGVERERDVDAVRRAHVVVGRRPIEAVHVRGGLVRLMGLGDAQRGHPHRLVAGDRRPQMRGRRRRDTHCDNWRSTLRDWDRWSIGATTGRRPWSSVADRATGTEPISSCVVPMISSTLRACRQSCVQPRMSHDHAVDDRMKRHHADRCHSARPRPRLALSGPHQWATPATPAESRESTPAAAATASVTVSAASRVRTRVRWRRSARWRDGTNPRFAASTSTTARCRHRPTRRRA